MIFTPLATTKLRHGEYVQFGTDVITLNPDADIKAVNLFKPFGLFKTNFDTVNSAYKKIQASSLTEQIADEDEDRDDLFLGIWGIAEAYLYHPDIAYVNHAKLLLNHLKSYGKGVIKASYPSETASIKNIIYDWETDNNLKAAITALHLTDWKDLLNQTNLTFESLYNDRLKNTTIIADITTMRVAKADSIKLWRKFLGALEGQNTLLEDDPKLGPQLHLIINRINALHDQYQTIITIRESKAAARKARKESEKAKEQAKDAGTKTDTEQPTEPK